MGFRISFMIKTPNEKFKDTFKTIKLIKNLKLRKGEYASRFKILLRLLDIILNVYQICFNKG